VAPNFSIVFANLRLRYKKGSKAWFLFFIQSLEQSRHRRVNWNKKLGRQTSAFYLVNPASLKTLSLYLVLDSWPRAQKFSKYRKKRFIIKKNTLIFVDPTVILIETITILHSKKLTI